MSTTPDPSSRTCAVIGAHGFVGSAITLEAAERGYRVTPIDIDNYDAARGGTFDLVINANGNSRKFLAAEQPAKEFDLSVRSVMRALHDFNAAQTIHLSSMDVYFPRVSDPAENAEDAPIDPARQSPYGFHKYLAEQIVRHYGRNWLIFRMAGFVGKGLWKNSIHDLLHGHAIRVHPDSEYQYLNTRDLARIVFDVAGRGVRNEIINVAGDGVVTLREVASMIPGCRLEEAWNTLPRERYEMNINKVRTWVSVPRTRDTVAGFVREALKDKEAAR